MPAAFFGQLQSTVRFPLGCALSIIQFPGFKSARHGPACHSLDKKTRFLARQSPQKETLVARVGLRNLVPLHRQSIIGYVRAE